MSAIDDYYAKMIRQLEGEEFEAMRGHIAMHWRSGRADERMSEIGRRARRWLAGYLSGDKSKPNPWPQLGVVIPGGDVVIDEDYMAGVADRAMCDSIGDSP